MLGKLVTFGCQYESKSSFNGRQTIKLEKKKRYAHELQFFLTLNVTIGIVPYMLTLYIHDDQYILFILYE
jgi:hypothetical protein